MFHAMYSHGCVPIKGLYTHLPAVTIFGAGQRRLLDDTESGCTSEKWMENGQQPRQRDSMKAVEQL